MTSMFIVQLKLFKNNNCDIMLLYMQAQQPPKFQIGSKQLLFDGLC